MLSLEPPRQVASFSIYVYSPCFETIAEIRYICSREGECIAEATETGRLLLHICLLSGLEKSKEEIFG